MNKEVIISITGKQLGDEDSTIEYITEGKYYIENGKQYICYREAQMSGFDDSDVTTLKIDGNVLTMIRNGKNNAQMVFEKGRKHLGHYETQYGSFTIGILTDDLDVRINDSGGDISLDYTIEINNVVQGRNGLHLHIRELQ